MSKYRQMSRLQRPRAKPVAAGYGEVSEKDLREFERIMKPLNPADDEVVSYNDYMARCDTAYRKYPQIVARIRRKALLQPVPLNGSLSAGKKAGYFQTNLGDGTTGYLARRLDDCFRMAIATLMQIPPYRVPDLHVYDQLAAGMEIEELDRMVDMRLKEWQDQMGFTVMIHPVPPLSARRWIGIAPGSVTDNALDDHCLVMSGRACLFEPSNVLPAENYGTGISAEDVDFGITIERR